MKIIDRAIELYKEAYGDTMHWFVFYEWGIQNNRYGFQKYIDKAKKEQTNDNPKTDNR